MKTFLHKFLTESTQPDEIDDFIDQWHEQSDPFDTRSLNEYLGLSKEQYALFVTDPQALFSSLQEEFEKDKMQIMRTAYIYYRNNIDELLSLQEPKSSPCGCLGSQNNCKVCYCVAKHTIYKYRYQIHKELTDDLGYYEESFGDISIKPKELIPLTSVQLELFNL